MNPHHKRRIKRQIQRYHIIQLKQCLAEASKVLSTVLDELAAPSKEVQDAIASLEFKPPKP